MAQQLEWNESAPVEASEPGSAFDVLGIVWRRKWAALCVVVLCLGLGYLYYQQATPIYRSDVQLLLIKKDAKVGGDTSSSKSSPYGGYEDALSTQMITVCSPKVVGPAVAQSRLAKLPSFQTRDFEDCADLNAAVTGTIIAQLKVGRAGDRTRPDPNVMNLSLEGPFPEDCQKILEAVVARYDAFLKDTYRDFSKETLDLIQKARDELEKDLRKKQDEYATYRIKSPLTIKVHERGSMTYNELNMGAIATERIKVQNERSQTKALADGIAAALLNGVDKEALRLLVRNIQLDQRFAARQTYLDALLHTMLDELEAIDTYGRDHPKVRTAQAKLAYLREQLGNSGDLHDSESFLKMYLETLRQEMKVADDKIKELDRDFKVESDAAKKATADQLREENLHDEIERTRLLFDAVVKRLAELNMVKDFGGITLERLSEPGRGLLVRPKLPIILAVAGVFGLFAGVGLCYVIELADRSFRSPDDVRRQLGVPIVGHIPVIPAHHSRHGKRKDQAADSPLHPIICTHHQPRGRQAEAYRAVRTSLYFGIQGESHKVFQITSPNPGDGKTTLAANLAVSIADSGKRVLLIDADFRRPKVHKYFGLDNSIGVSMVVAGESEVLDAILPTAVENLSAMPCGPKPHNPADLLTSPRFKEMLDLVRDKYDFVLIDTPPLLAVTDPSVVAPRVDGVLMVLRLTKHTRDAAIRASELLNSLGAHTLGVVINGIGKGTGYGYGSYRYGGHGYGKYRKGYGYGYGYGSYGYGESTHGNGAGSYYADDKTEGGRQAAGNTNRDRSGGTAKTGQ